MPVALRCSATRSTTRCTGGEARTHLVREHGAGLLPARGRGRRSPGRADRPQRAAALRRARRGPDLLDRVRAERRPAAAAAASLRQLRGSGRLDPARVAQAARAGAHRRGHSGVGDVGRADQGAAAGGRARPARRGGRREAPDRGCRAEVRLRGPHSALRPGPVVARADGTADGVRRLGVPGAALRRPVGARGRARRVGSARARRARTAGTRGERPLRVSRRLPRALFREAALSLRTPRAGRADDVPGARTRRGRARRRAGAAVRPRGGRRLSVAPILEKALDGERITDDDALALLESRDLVSIGRAANELRNRKADPSRITFIIDRNLNYTNICYTDCEFCAFYRRPGDTREGYLLPKPVIFKKIEETIALGGTGLLMQGGHHPDLAIDYYEDLFRSIKARYKIHLHALSPPEVQHIARRSKLTLWQTISRLRDAGLDSIPGGGGEILVDRVREEIAPKKTKTKEWLEVMRHTHRLGMSTTATMMYGHVETVAERIEHMRRIRELQDETGGFRAFISWTFQNDGNRLAGKVAREDMPTSFDYLLTQAVSRIYLDNVPHIQSSWVTQGLKIGQVALGFGADDLGSVMIEENVVSAAGTTYRTSTEELVHLIRSMGKTPVQRDTLYRDVKVWN